MRAGLFILSFILILTGLRCINVLDDVVTAIVAVGLGILCFYGAMIYNTLGKNKGLDE